MADSFYNINKGITLKPQGTTPSNPTNGDVWYDTTSGKFKIRENGTTKDMSAAAASGGLASTAPGSAITANYTIVSGDNGRTLNVDTITTSIQITLPTPSANFSIIIKDYRGNSATNNITIVRAGSEKIDDATGDDAIKSNYASVVLVSDGTNWFRVADFTGVAPTGLSRGLFGGGATSGGTDQSTIDYIDIVTTGNSATFGNLTVARSHMMSACASSTRGIFSGGDQTGNEIDYVSIMSLGNATTFGTLGTSRNGSSSLSSSTRGVTGGGFTSGPTATTSMEYITIATTGNGTSFGSLTTARYFLSSLASTTRGVYGGGRNAAGTLAFNTMDYITIASTGNATNFGNLTVARRELAGLSNNTRGVFCGGYDGSSLYNTMDYITIASTGNATNFGNLASSRDQVSALASSVRGVIAGGFDESSAAYNTIEYITIASTGNTTNFGNLTSARRAQSGTSNVHGGI